MIRTGFSFRFAAGHLEEVMAKVKEIGLSKAPICDRNSTFAFNRWTKLCKKNEIEPVYGVEIGVTSSLGDKKPVLDYWKFLAKDSIRPINDLVGLATSNPGKEPSITYDQARKLSGLFKISGERVLLDEYDLADPDFFIGLSPSLPLGTIVAAKKLGLKFCSISDNVYTSEKDREFYRVMMGGRANTQSYPQYILSDEEWKKAIVWPQAKDVKESAIKNRNSVLERCNAKLKQGTLVVPEKPKTLRQMCLDGAVKLGCDLARPGYQDRLDRELSMIAEKNFEDYFYVLADVINFAKTKMIVGPARGSSCGSLVCYLIGITTIDPIPFGLIFERFIDITRADLPDVDVDFSDERRHLVFEYMEKKFGRERIARLGSVGQFKPRSALHQVGIALRIPSWTIEKVAEGAIKRAFGDSRSSATIEDTLKDTEAGRSMLLEFPEALIVARMENHPNSIGQHAAGIVITQEPIAEYVAVDSKTGAAMCDKKDAEDLNLLKIDALGLTQLSIFERTLDLIGIKEDYNVFLNSLPLDDPTAFEVLNRGNFSGVFQFIGSAVQGITKEIVVDSIEDLIAITALARPGPLASGGTDEWIKRRNGAKVEYPHPIFKPYLEDSLGIVIYQETVLKIGREVGDLTWADVTALRKAMSKSLGKEEFDKYGDPWKAAARQKGIPEDVCDKFWNDMCLAEDTLIRLPISKSKPLTIKELYEKYEANPSYENERKGLKPALVSLFPDGKGRTQRAVKIIKSGRKECWKYEFDDGSQVTCTSNHRFIVNGAWKKIGLAKIGDDFLSIADDYSSRGMRKLNRTGAGSGSGKRDRCGKFSGTGRQKISKEFISEMRGKPCADCGRVKKNMEAHHNDFVEGRKRPHDLTWLCASDHRKRHWQSGRGATPAWGVGKLTTTKKLVKVTKAGVKEVYDVSMAKHSNFSLQNGLIAHNCQFGAWAFNRAHSVAYGMVSYWCCWLKAHHPLEFAAATMDVEADPGRQIQMLRELAKEGVEYVAFDPERSVERWIPKRIGNTRKLIGPLTNVDGIGPAAVMKILDARKKGVQLEGALAKKMESSRTKIDSLWPIRDAVKRICPDLRRINIVSDPAAVIDIQSGYDGSVMAIVRVDKISSSDVNAPVKVAKRGGRVLGGPTTTLNVFASDDTDEMLFWIDRFDFERLGRKIMEVGGAGKSLWAFKGRVPRDFRMMRIEMARYIGRVDDPSYEERLAIELAKAQSDEEEAAVKEGAEAKRIMDEHNEDRYAP